MIRVVYIGILAIAFIAVSCKKNEIDHVVEPFTFDAPDYFPAVQYDFEDNEVSKGRFELGKLLFYDPVLSSDSTVSCASCHIQTQAFADQGMPQSIGVNGGIGKRNSPSIANMAFMPAFMWDGGVNHIEVFSLAPITDTNEMNETMSNVIDKLNNNDDYRWLFKRFYKVDEVNDQVLFKSLTVYMSMIISDNSKFDKWKRGEVQLSNIEESGRLLFESKCSGCHAGALQTDYSYRNNGLSASSENDLGRGRITLDPQDYGKFKVPSLRNVMLTYPYMHNGSIATIRDVLDHYDSGIVQSSTLDPILQSGIPLSESEKDEIIAFLETLTDYELLYNELFSK